MRCCGQSWVLQLSTTCNQVTSGKGRDGSGPQRPFGTRRTHQVMGSPISPFPQVTRGEERSGHGRRRRLS